MAVRAVPTLMKDEGWAASRAQVLQQGTQGPTTLLGSLAKWSLSTINTQGGILQHREGSNSRSVCSSLAPALATPQIQGLQNLQALATCGCQGCKCVLQALCP